MIFLRPMALSRDVKREILDRVFCVGDVEDGCILRPATQGREKQARRSYTGPGGSWRRFCSDQTPRAPCGNHKQTNSGWTEEKTWDVGRSPQTYRGSNAETLGGSKEVREKETVRPLVLEPGHEKIYSNRLTSIGLFFCPVFLEDIFIAKF